MSPKILPGHHSRNDMKMGFFGQLKRKRIGDKIKYQVYYFALRRRMVSSSVFPNCGYDLFGTNSPLNPVGLELAWNSCTTKFNKNMGYKWNIRRANIPGCIGATDLKCYEYLLFRIIPLNGFYINSSELILLNELSCFLKRRRFSN